MLIQEDTAESSLKAIEPRAEVEPFTEPDEPAELQISAIPLMVEAGA